MLMMSQPARWYQALSARVEKRGPSTDDDRAAVAHGEAELARRPRAVRAEVLAVRIGRRDVADVGPS